MRLSPGHTIRIRGNEALYKVLRVDWATKMVDVVKADSVAAKAFTLPFASIYEVVPQK